ncbi:MAG TPA: DUF2934 domain-containing protein [Dissulfurispiraceae bacterium]|nr:DUF2934 domain-containing protein [Dissulfurispiraceae bacterium]
MSVHHEVARVAYELYEKNGKVDSHDLDHWLEAERIVGMGHNGENRPARVSTKRAAGKDGHAIRERRR